MTVNKRYEINPEIEDVFDKYPKTVRQKLLKLRSFIIDEALKLNDNFDFQETLKWGEPSYVTKYGSTIRIAWKANIPGQYGIYFKCTSKLVPSFKDVFGDLFSYEGNRAIIFQMEDQLPVEQLKICIRAGLNYHKVKKLPFLGLIIVE